MSTVYSLYLWGNNHFLHFSPNKGSFNNQLGTAYINFKQLNTVVVITAGNYRNEATLKKKSDDIYLNFVYPAVMRRKKRNFK